MLEEGFKRGGFNRGEEIMDNSDRRLHPRIDCDMPINVMADGYDFLTTTRNVSCLGAYCHISKYVPPFTKLKIKLSLPVNRNNTTGHFDVACKGVVVRTEDDPAGGFNIAVFFSDIKSPQQHKIAEYINQFIPH
jgi:hypothetical protein